jgi:predicted nucleic-acid-binding protein
LGSQYLLLTDTLLEVGRKTSNHIRIVLVKYREAKADVSDAFVAVFAEVLLVVLELHL